MESKAIEIDTTAVDAQSPEMIKRLDRIERNYSKLDAILADLEATIELDERLATVSEKADAESYRPKQPR